MEERGVQRGKFLRIWHEHNFTSTEHGSASLVKAPTAPRATACLALRLPQARPRWPHCQGLRQMDNQTLAEGQSRARTHSPHLGLLAVQT